MKSLFTCPVCGAPLEIDDKTYFCAQGHSFDRAAKGYVNLLLSNQKNSKEPGDDTESLKARRRFLSAGFYTPLATALGELAVEYAPQTPTVLDCCCGEGYYTKSILQALHRAGKVPAGAAFDISRIGVRMAATKPDPTEYAVASVFRIPAPDARFDLALLCFAPYCDRELTRILKSGSILLRVLPGRRHLFGLKALLYDHPYENDEQGEFPSVLKLEAVHEIRERIVLSGEQANDLLAMTPYAYRTDPAALTRFRQLSALDTEIEFRIECFRKPR